MAQMARWFSLVLLLGMVGCDHATKYVAKAELEGDSPRKVLGSLLDLRYVENTDMAFSMLRFIGEDARRPLLLVLGAVGVVALAVFLARAGTPLTRAAALLLLAGAAGNYLDRVFRGYVVDFLHVPYWPVFNVADIYLATGMGALLLATWRQRATPAASA